MITANTSEPVASQELKNPIYRVFHSGIVALENTAVLGMARDEIGREFLLKPLLSTSYSELLLRVAPADNETKIDQCQGVRTVDLDLLSSKVFYVNEGTIKNETETHIPHSVPGRLAKRHCVLSVDNSRSTNDAVWVPTLTDRIPTTEAIETALDLPAVVRKFAKGVGDIRPISTVVKEAARVVQAAIKYTSLSHITVDDEDGDLDFDFRNGDNQVVMANFFPDGTIDASVYDDSDGIPVRVRRIQRRSETSADDLISIFE